MELGVVFYTFPIVHVILTEYFFVLFDVMSGYTRNAMLVVDRMNIVTDVTCVVVLGFKGWFGCEGCG